MGIVGHKIAHKLLIKAECEHGGITVIFGMNVVLGAMRASVADLGGLNRLGHCRRSEQVHHPFEVVGEHMQAHLGTDLVQCPCEVVRVAHPGLDRPKGMLGSLSAHSHDLRGLVQSRLTPSQSRIAEATKTDE